MGLYTFISASEKNKAIAVVSLVVITLAMAFFYQGVSLHSRTIDQVIMEKEKSIDATVKDLTHFSFSPYEKRLSNLLTTHPEIAAAFIKKDRDTLHRLTSPLFKALKSENKHLHVMHYHRPDGRSFLRMHKPEKFDDDLRQIRPAIQHVHQIKKPLTCYEIGIYGAFYRVIQPVFHQGEYAGVLELGIKVHTFMESLQKHISDPLTTFYMTEKWQKVITPQDFEFLSFGEHTLNTHNAPLYTKLPMDLDLATDNQRVIIAGKAYLIHAYPIFKDFQGDSIGGFIVMQDLSQPLAAKKAFILQTLLFTCLLLFVALLVLHLTFGKLIGKIERSRSALEKTVFQLGLEVEEKEKTQSQLYKSKEEWERTFDAIGDVVTIMDSDFRIIKANKAAHEMLGMEPGSLVGKFCYEAFRSEHEVCEGCPAILTIEGFQIHTAEVEHPNLNKKLLITTSPVPDESGEFTHIVHIAKDITTQRHLESQLRQAQKMEAIGTLAGGIAHDFNNILTAISGFCQLAIMKTGEELKILPELKRIQSATDRAINLVDQILTFSRQTEHDKRPITIAPIIKEALKLLRSSIPTNIELKQDIENHGSVLADPTQIHQIVMNLATNAYHAMMETGGILSVTVKEVTINGRQAPSGLKIDPGQYILLEVNDTGFGMDETTKSKIFEPYFTTKEVGKGTGLGLAVVHGIIRDHHGYIHVDSEPGKGTAFHIYLPTVKEQPTEYKPPSLQEPVRGGDERIMFVDDEDFIVHLAMEALKTYGYTTTVFTNGVQAIQDFQKQPDNYDLVITDLSMPHMTGLELAQQIKEIRPALPIILTSGFGESLYTEKAKAMGIDTFIQKPLDIERLARVIRELLD